MKSKKMAIALATLAVIAIALTGWKSISSKEMLNMINNGESIVLEVAKPNYEIKVTGKQQEKLDWIQLDQLKSYNNGFRQGFDELFNINIVTEGKINGKSGCLYVDESGDRNGNTTLEDALRNKVFVTKYWQESTVKNKLAKLGAEVYTDVGESETYAIAGAINAYYNLMTDGVNPNAFNPTQSLSREEFYTLVFKTEEGVKQIAIDENFEKAIGGATKFSKYAQEVDEYGFLSVANKSLDGNSFKGSISRAEAIHMVVTKHFQEELSKLTGKEKAFKDTKNAGDIALKAGFKYKDKESKEIVSKDRWQSYTLAYMLQNPDKGMQEELYKSMVVAKNLGLIGGEESRWDEPISKAESIILITNTHLKKNSLYGYTSTIEYGKINVDKFKTATSEDKAIGKTKDGMEFGDGWVQVPSSQVPINPNTKIKGSEITYGEAKKSFEYHVKDMEKMCKELGVDYKTDKDAIKITENYLNSLGVTMEEIARVREVPAAEKPAKPSTNNGTVTQPEKNNEQNNSNGVQSGMHPQGGDLEKLIKEQKEMLRKEGVTASDGKEGGTSSDPNFKLDMD